MSIIEDVLKRASAEEVKVEDLRSGDRFVTTVDEHATSGIFVRFDEREYELEYLPEEGEMADVEGVFTNGQRWYLVERAPIEEPTGWGAIVEVDGVNYSRIPDDAEDAQDSVPWIREAGVWCDWKCIVAQGVPKILFEGISE